MYAVSKKSQEQSLDREIYGKQPAVGRCAFCPDFLVDGTADQVMEATKNHRVSVHPEITVKKVRRGTGRPCSNGLCENLASVKRGRFVGLCGACRDQKLADEKSQAQRERAEERERQRARLQDVDETPEVVKIEKPAKVARLPVVRPSSSEPHPMHKMTWERAEEVIRLYQEGHSAVSIGRANWQRWGYRNDKSLTQMVYGLLKTRGIPRRSRSESAKITYARDGRPVSTYRQPSLLTESRLQVVDKLVSAGCSVRSIAIIAWEPWGYASTESCREAIARIGRRNGTNVNVTKMKEIPLVSRHEAKQMIDAA